MSDTVELIIVVGALGGIGAYVTNFQGFKDWVDSQFKGGGNSGGCPPATVDTCQATRTNPNQTSLVQAVKILTAAVANVYRTTSANLTTTQLNCLYNKITSTDVKSVQSAFLAVCNANCSDATATNYLKTMYNIDKKYASSCGFSMKPFTTNITVAKVVMSKMSNNY